MPKTEIDYVDRSINPIRGLCPKACPYCYARRLYQRFHWDPTIRFDIDVLNELHLIKKPSRFFIGSTIEMFGPWVSSRDIQFILDEVRIVERHTGIFLTKCPERLAEFDWPQNAWVGTTVTNQQDAEDRLWRLRQVEAPVRFVSFEPLLGPVEAGSLRLQGIHWIIIGAQTGPGAIPPRSEWVRTILQAADIANIPVFLKSNLKWPVPVQDYPEVENGQR